MSKEQVKGQIPHTWPLFFARHGNFTAVQYQALPFILAGQDVLAIAPTASGKTEAALAPLLERGWEHLRQRGLQILYICPTRALVRDLYERLRPVLADTGIGLAMKTGDTGSLNSQRLLAQRPLPILLTTPESTDSLLTRQPRLFATLQAVVLDEIHLFDNTPRGDHLRCLLARIERIRHHAQPDTAPMQRVALSATVPDPQGVAQRYLHQGVVVQIRGGRELLADIQPLYDLNELVAALAQRAVQKSLVFCNSRAEVEQTAVYLRHHLPHHAELFVHYSNLDAQMRQEVESRFAAAAVAVCVCTSTLELGIDIGSVDEVVLLGAPYSLTSFLQRAGRGGRRAAQMKVLCLPKSPQEWLRFEALLALASAEEMAIDEIAFYGFRPSVLVQQIFSLIKQSPTGSIRLADLRRIAPAELLHEDLRQIIAHLAFTGYLRSGRLGEWKPDQLLNELLDRHQIYSNIGADLLTATAVDAYTGRVIAQTEQVYETGSVVLFGGQPMRVNWHDRYRFGLVPAPGQEVDAVLHFLREKPAIPFNVAQAVARLMGFGPGQMATLPAETGLWLFHFCGSVWGQLLTAVLLALGVGAQFINEHCLHLAQRLDQLPPWDDAAVQTAVRRTAETLANRLEMGCFHSLLPPNIALTAVTRLLNLRHLQQLYIQASLVPADPNHQQLHLLTQSQ